MRTKRLMIIITAAVLAVMMLMTGCKKQTYKNPVPPNARNQTPDTETAEMQEESEEDSDALYYSDHETLEEAVSESGIDLILPETDGYHADRYSNAGTVFIEALFTEDTTPAGEETNQFIIRRQPTDSAQDISGDDTAYQTEAISEIGGCNVTIRSQDGKGYVAIWFTSGSSWAVISRYGMNIDTFTRLVSETVMLNKVN